MAKLPKFSFNGLHNAAVVLAGDPKNPEPETVTVRFPGGEVEVTRCTDGKYWVHVRTWSEREAMESEDFDVPRVAGKFVGARLDGIGVGCMKNMGDFENPALNHVALLVAKMAST